MPYNDEFDKFQIEIDSLLNSFLEADDEQGLEGFDDPFVTAEQKERDSQITSLLKAYVEYYQTKSTSSKCYRLAILITCLSIVVAFAISLIFIMRKVVNLDAPFLTEQIVAFITACISFISLIIGLLTIITKYFFPEDDEKYITQIVETIQRNDLENKRENAKNTNEKTERIR